MHIDNREFSQSKGSLFFLLDRCLSEVRADLLSMVLFQKLYLLRWETTDVIPLH